MEKSVFGLASSEEHANRIVDQLMSNGFSNEDISILSPDRTQRTPEVREVGALERDDVVRDESVRDESVRDADFDERRDMNYENRVKGKKGKMTTEVHTKAPEGGVTGAATGGVLGGSLGLLAGIGALAIPGLGPFIAAGPIMAALGGSAVGGSLGLLIGALVGYGIPEFEAKKYEAGLKAGNILISVHTESGEEVDRAKDIMKKAGAKDITSSSEKAKSSY